MEDDPSVRHARPVSKNELSDAHWDEYGERIVGSGICVHCGEELDQWEVRMEPDLEIAGPVLLWKHSLDGAVLCGRTRVATPQ